MRHGTWILALVCLGWPTGCGSSQSADSDAAAVTETSDSTAATRSREPEGNPRVLIETSRGNITVELDAERAPLTVDNFLGYVDRGHYAGTIFHQVIAGYVALGGGFQADLTEKPTMPPVRNEADNGLSNRRGTIAMARQPESIDSAASQFFFNLDDNSALDYQGRAPEEYGYCVFGTVIEGEDVLHALSQTPVTDKDDFVQTPVEPIAIRAMKRLR
jgi:cyclophilin family peptidyl-prolyl cis-trans isomerase